MAATVELSTPPDIATAMVSVNGKVPKSQGFKCLMLSGALGLCFRVPLPYIKT
jgi:hypothetical protein